jgi:hypothetical protein
MEVAPVVSRLLRTPAAIAAPTSPDQDRLVGADLKLVRCLVALSLALARQQTTGAVTRAMIDVVLWPHSKGTRTTLLPQDSMNSAPTTVARV